jgi:hypothetical protein
MDEASVSGRRRHALSSLRRTRFGNRANTRGNVLNIVNERSDDVHAPLSGGKTMRFLALGLGHRKFRALLSNRTDETSDPTQSVIEPLQSLQDSRAICGRCNLIY